MVGSRPASRTPWRLLGGTTNLRNLSVDLQRQLRHSIAGFSGAVDEFHRNVLVAERQKLDFLSQMVLRPLDYLSGQPMVRVVLDGLNQLSDDTRHELRKVLDASPDHLRLVITTRDNTRDCPDGWVIYTSRTDRAVLLHYLEDRGVPVAARAAVLDRADGSLADHAAPSGCRRGKSGARLGPPPGDGQRSLHVAPGPGRGGGRLANTVQPGAGAAGCRRVRPDLATGVAHPSERDPGGTVEL